jgi:transposase-like protein
MCSIVKLFKQFPTNESCVDFLEKKRFAKGYYCLYCGSTKVSKHNEKERRSRLQCSDCKKSFSVTVGTIFHNTKLDLRKWFWIISLMINAKKGISSHQVARELEMRQATVWSVMHRVRKAMKTEQGELLRGIFEMDETYLQNNKNEKDDDDNHKGGHSNKTHTPVIAFKEKNGDLKAFVATDTTSATLSEIIINNIETGSEIHTDEYNAYKFTRKFWKHKSVNHSLEYITKDGIHTNSVEGFWSLLKRGIKGNFHFVTKKYLENYVTEFEYRYNNRENELVFSDILNRMLVC